MKTILHYTFLLLVTGISNFIFAQTGTLQGTVQTSDGIPVPYVRVALINTNHSAMTDSTGNFRIEKIAAGTYTLVTSHVGLTKQETSVMIHSNEVTQLKISLIENANQLREIEISTTQKTDPNTSLHVAKIPLKNLENSQTYSVVDRTLMDSRQVNNMEDGMKSATGVSVVFPATGRATDGGTYYTTRGFTTSSSLMNGIAGAVYSNPDAFGIERIEVLKGPSGTLYGSSLTSFGGAINMVTKKPYETFGGNLSMTTGSWGLNRIAADINTPLNEPNTALFRLNTVYHHQNSFQDYGFTGRMAIAPSFSYRVSDKLSFLAESNFSKIEATLPCWYYADSATTGVISADQLIIDDTKYYFPGDLYTTTKSANSMVQVNYQFHQKWKSQTVFSNSYNESTGPLTYLWFVSDTSMTRNHQTFEGSTSQFNIQENIIGTFHTLKIKHRFLAGVDYYQNHSNSTYRWYGSMMDTVYTNTANPHYMNYNKDLYNKSDNTYFFGSYTGIQKTKRIGTYFSDVLNLTENLLLNVGARYDYFISEGYSDPQQDTAFGAYQQGGFSPKIGLVYQPVKDQIALFGNYQNSFQNVNGRDFYGKVFVPQQANQYEGGIKFNLLKNRLNGMVSYYNITVTNSVRLDQEHPTFSLQDGTQQSSGIEAELNLHGLYGFNLALGYAYNDNRYIQANDDVLGRRPVEAGAAHLGHAWLNYGITKGKFQGLGFGFGGNYSGEKMINNDTYYGVFYLPSYLVLNSSIFYGTDKFSLGLNINNLTNARYWVGWGSAVLQKPREVVANLTWKF